MTTSGLAEAIAAAFDHGPANEPGTFVVLREFDAPHGQLLVAVAPSGRSALLLPGVFGTSPSGFATRKLVATPAPKVTLTLGGTSRVVAATIVECGDAQVVQPFAALAVALLALLREEASASWPSVHCLLKQWSSLFAEGRMLDDKEALGLWGELWVIASSSRPTAMIEGWRGPHAGVADFVLEAGRLEVKTATRPFVHHVSHTQLELDRAYFLSLSADEGEDGKTLSDLAQAILAALPDPSLLYAGLTRIGCSLETLELSRKRRVMLSGPALFRAEHVPRVREVDPGVSNLRYTVTLDPSKALRGGDLTDAAAVFGLSLDD